ncbi:MAG: DUF262 domain-containing protein, partial [Muribaculaceae bacterium]|nr:DUF262 domain-containing protein [Muribaculaceae bacterium]
MLTSPEPHLKLDLIKVPKIQRDYVQGRPGKESLRENFLNTLFSAIDNANTDPIELDFIYGKEDKRERVLLPVDGQQRLTTLFLLHLYLAKRLGKDTDFLEAFTYEVRQSSKDFMKKLINIDSTHFSDLNSYIEKQWWFNSRWKNDPTIHSMLVMLKEISRHYSDYSQEQFGEVWQRLTKEQKIKFWLLNLDDLDTTDDLYIKMNSRGQQLTDFEHFKADIEWQINEARKKGIKINTHFSRKIDTDWTVLLWGYRDNYDTDPEKYYRNGLDDRIQNLFRNFMIIEGTKAGITYSDKEGKERVYSIDDFRRMNILELADIVLKQNISLIDRFSRILDFFYAQSLKESISGFFGKIVTNTPFEMSAEKREPEAYRVFIPKGGRERFDFLKAALQQSVFNIDYLFIEAFFEYAAASSGNEPDYMDIRERLRVVRNLVENAFYNIRQETMPTLLKRVDSLMASTDNLDSEEKESFPQVQVREEILKLNWIKENPADKLTIMLIENHSLLVGDLSAYTEMKENKLYVSSLESHGSFFSNTAMSNLDKVEVLLLTFGDYGKQAGWKRLYGGRIADNWRMDIFSRAEKHTGNIIREMLLMYPLFDERRMKEHIENWLKECDDEGVYRWRYYLVKYPSMRSLQSARYQKTYWDNNRYDWQMLNSPTRRGYYQFVFLNELNEQLNSKKPDSAEIRQKGDPLHIKDLGWTVYQTEKGYRINYVSDGEKMEQTLVIPQTPEDIDTIDRVKFFIEFYNETCEKNGNS